MENKKCDNCGQCCLSAPCFYIPIGTEKYVEVNGQKIHKCKYQEFDSGNKSTCKLYRIKKQDFNGYCTNSKLK